jgi:hypothetical protein
MDTKQHSPTLFDATEVRIRVLDFDDEDVRLNSQGRLSERQQQEIRNSTRKNMRDSVVSISTGMIISFPLVYIGYLQSRETLENNPEIAQLVYGVGALALGIILVGGLLYLTFRAMEGGKMLREKVASVSGAVKKTVRDDGSFIGVGWYHIKVDKKRFLVPAAFHQAIEDNTHYTLYYLPKTKLIVSFKRD